MKLIDTSAWVNQIRRRGNPEVKERVNALLTSGQAGWCAVVRIELWAGVGSDAEREALRSYEQVVPEYGVTPEVWSLACVLADRARHAGQFFSSADLVIAACARHHGVELEHADPHFDALLKL